jgi:hypothetical protein
MDAKLMTSLRVAAPRFLWGILGTWCCLGPIIILAGSGSSALKVALSLSLFVGYGYVFHIWSRQGSAPIRRMIIEARSAMCFMIVGLLLSEITGIFTGLKLELSALYAFIGFFLAVNYSHKFRQIKLSVYDKLSIIFQVMGIERSSVTERAEQRKA